MNFKFHINIHVKFILRQTVIIFEINFITIIAISYYLRQLLYKQTILYLKLL